MPKFNVRIGRFILYLWSGSWCWVDRLDCAHCWNLYVGPMGVEWERREYADDTL